MPNYRGRDPSDPKSIYQTAGESLPDVESFLRDMYGAQEELNPMQTRQMGEDFSGVLGEFMPGYTGTAEQIGMADIGLDEAKRRSMGEFFSGGEYGDVISSMEAADPRTYGAMGSLAEQSEMLGGATRGLIEGAGVLNERERANIEDRARGAFTARGRGMDTSGIATEIGDVIEAERLDRGRDLSTAAGLMGAQGNIMGQSSAIQNQFMSQLLGADQSIMPGLGAAESMVGTAAGVGLDPGELFNIAGLQTQQDFGLEAAREEADAIKEAGYYSAASPFLSEAAGGVSDWLTKIFGNQGQP
jgi:hypothetical protein